MDFEAAMAADSRPDVEENDQEYRVGAELPGAKKDDIRVEIDGKALSPSARMSKNVEARAPRAA